MIFSFITDEELMLDYSLDRDLRDYHKLYWEREFKPVAEKLLHRIQSHPSFPLWLLLHFNQVVFFFRGVDCTVLYF